MPGERVWLITGASSGFGRELVDATLERGDRVAATARNTDPLGGLDGRGDVALLSLDVTDAGLTAELDAWEEVGRATAVDDA
jgi:NAD(P)-dependent dehydrogenase (short-subunit alcohol dehydrogenase family)